jgi:hypothetical protein
LVVVGPCREPHEQHAQALLAGEIFHPNSISGAEQFAEQATAGGGGIDRELAEAMVG